MIHSRWAYVQLQLVLQMKYLIPSMIGAIPEVS